MIDLYIFDPQLNIIDEESEYINLEIERKLDTYSQMILRIQANSNTLASLKIGNIITTQSNPSYGYMIEHIEYSQNNSEVLEVVAFSLNYILSFRSVYPQQVFYGNNENAIRYFVERNAINPTNSRRKIPLLTLSPTNNIGTTSTFIKTGGELLEYVMQVANEVGATVDILINHQQKNMYLSISRGVNRSASQSTNPRVMFSEDFDNILSQNYFVSYLDYKNAPVIAGEGEGTDRQIVDINTNAGLNRRELYVDARDLQSTYQDDNNVQQTISPANYTNALVSRGEEALLETKVVETFEAEIDDTQFVYGRDYLVGDIVSVKNLLLNLTVDVPVSSVKIISNSSGTQITPSLGTALPDLYRRGGK